MQHRWILAPLLVAAPGLSLVGWSAADSNGAGAAPGKFVPGQTFSVDQHPEALARDGGALFVSSMGPKRQLTEDADADGSVQRLLEDGSRDPSFSAGGDLRDPMGMAVMDDTIAVLDIDRVVLVARDTGALRDEIPNEIPFDEFNTHRLNDITKISDRQVIVSATDTEQVFLVDIESGKATELKVEPLTPGSGFKLHNPNGLIFDHTAAVLYIGGNLVNGLASNANGIVTKAEVDLAGGKIIEVWTTPPFGWFLDGIDLKGESVVVSDWGAGGTAGAIHELDAERGEITVREDVGVRGFADLIWGEDGQGFTAVSMSDHQVRLYGVGK